MLRDVIRKWWRAELSFADDNGSVREWVSGEIVPPSNDFCRLSLFSKEGLRRCSQSVKVLHEKFVASPKLRHAVFHDCHLGFAIVGVPLYLNGRYEGFLFVEGFSRAPVLGKDAEALKVKIRELNSGNTDLEKAVERIPQLHTPDADRLADLLQLAVSDIADYEAEQLRREERSAHRGESEKYRVDNIVGKSGAMRQVFQLLHKIAQSDSTVLVNGESGTGKELVAGAIHHLGPRKDRAFVAQNCSALNDNLLESALFGHVKGAFTGAVRDSKGLFEVADGGTLFLDEIGDMSPALQLKLMRAIQEGSFMPLGGTAERTVDVRVIAATHKDLATLVEKGEFREDLFYRVNVIRIQIPPLRERRDDLPLLVEHFLKKHRKANQRVRALSEEAMGVLHAYGWPGNIRELENEIERLLVLGSDEEVIPADLISPRIRSSGGQAAPAGSFSFGGAPANLNAAVELLEREMIHQGLIRTRHNKSQLARELGISRSNLILKIAKYGLERPQSAGAGGDDGEEEASA
ncbi:MAG TPA: sigma 54-interacting transcriptional regulator [Myxococcales bacterium]|nr:sigma 54-interacting transcriptional regulator [Myxococcales bacterium]